MFKLPKQAEKRNPIVGIIIGFAVSLIIGLSFNDSTKQVPLASEIYDLMWSLEYKLLDLRFRLRGALPGKMINDDIVLLDYDDETVEWAPFPPDRTYYAEIIRALGEKDSKTSSTFFDIFFFDPFGRQLDVTMTEKFEQIFAQLPEKIAEDGEITADMKTKLYEAYNAVNSGNTAAAKQIFDQLLADGRLRGDIDFFQSMGMVFDNEKDLSSLAPDRDIVLRDAIRTGGNVYLAQIVNDKEKTPYNIDDIIYDPAVHKIFARMIQLADKTKTKSKMDVHTNAAITNLVIEDYRKLLSVKKLKPLDGRKPLGFSKKEIEAIKREMEGVKARNKAAMALNYKFGTPIAKNNPVKAEKLRGAYKNLVSIVPLNGQIVGDAAGIGYVKPEFQEYDGTIRMAAPFHFFQNRLYFHISLMLSMNYLGVDPAKDLEFHTDKIVMKNCLYPGAKKKTTITIPLYKKKYLLANWGGKFYEPDQFHHRSFRKVYETSVKYNVIKKSEQGQPLSIKDSQVMAELTKDEIAAVKKEIAFFKGKISLTGLTAASTHDVNPIPFHPRYPLVGMHGNLVNTIINRVFIRTTPFVILLILMLAIGTAIGYYAGHSKQLPGALATFGAIAVMAIISMLLFKFARLWLPFIPLLFSLIFVYLIVLVYRFMTEGQEARRIKGMFATYVNPSVVETLIHNPELLRLGGERMELTAMFALASGPGLESESAEELVDRLNEYFTAMTDEIFRFDGTLDKYEGKIIMAIFGAPVHFDDHSGKACLACAGMKKSLAAMQEKWKQENKETISITVGLNSGPMIAGNMGSASRFNYTIMGDSVNVSARILGVSIMYKIDFMISEFTYEAAKDVIVTRFVDNVVVVGKVEPVRVFQILGGKDDVIPDNVLKGKEAYERAYQLHCERKWDEAIAAFNSVMEYLPGDGPSGIFVKRCEGYKTAPPPDTWKGEFAMTKKGL